MDTIKALIKIIPFKCSRILLCIMCVFPIKRKKIFCESYSGKGYVCNPKYISEYINENYPGQYDIVWGMIDSEINKNTYYRTVKHNSLLYFYERLTAKIIITNVADAVYIPKRKTQVLINTWHAGGAYKRVGISVEGTDMIVKEWQAKKIRESTDVFLSSSKLFTKYNIIEGYGYNGEIINSGMPRNDLFFYYDKKIEAAKKINQIYGLDEKVVVLFAPTFRAEKENNLLNCFPVKEIEAVIRKQLNQECAILIRSHHYSAVRWNEKNKNVIDVTDYSDMQELLARADILITDFSSCMWDFSLQGKPCYIYLFEKQAYEKERGFFVPSDYWPGVVCEDVGELIKHMSKIDFESSKEKAQKHLDYFTSWEKGTATKTIVDKIIHIMEE